MAASNKSADGVAASTFDDTPFVTAQDIAANCYGLLEALERGQGGERRAGYGKRVLPEVAARLSDEFGNGFSLTNLSFSVSFIWPFQLVTRCVTNSANCP